MIFNCCNKLKNNTVENMLNFIPFNKFNLNFNDLNIKSHNIYKINDLLDEINNGNVFHRVKNNYNTNNSKNDIEMEEIPSPAPSQEHTPLSSSSRIAQIKSK